MLDFFTKRTYSLKKSREILYRAYSVYKKRKEGLSAEEQGSVKTLLANLEKAIQDKDKKAASQLAKEVEGLSRTVLKKTIWRQGFDLVFALAFALIAATAIRQMYMEHYEVPTGSMRPTLREKDHLLVAKTDFGINVPATPHQLYFDPSLVMRGGIVVFTVEGMDFKNGDMNYFYLFPGKKRLVKRMMGLPGDTLYFYGGQVYGVDKEGEEITDFREGEWTKDIEYIPFTNFDGVVEAGSSIRLKHLGVPVAEIDIKRGNQVETELLIPGAEHYRDIFGIKNYAKVRLVKRSELTQANHALPEAPLYLEVIHDPVFEQFTLQGVTKPEELLPRPHYTVIPLQEEHLQKLWGHLYTSRFFAVGGKLANYRLNTPVLSPMSPKLPSFPDGRYEYYHGNAYEVASGGTLTLLPEGHPLREYSHRTLQLLFNTGIDFNTQNMPGSYSKYVYPLRFAYYRNGDLYVMDTKLMEERDPALKAFIQGEQARAKKEHAYLPFIDHGAPLLADGSIDVEFVRKYGLTVPEKSYFVLGDNHTLSGDSRFFGFVPENNLRGAPTAILWPLGDRWGALPQPPHPWGTFSQVVVWSILGGACIIYITYNYRRKRKPLDL